MFVALSLTACNEKESKDVKVTVEVSQKAEDLTVCDYSNFINLFQSLSNKAMSSDSRYRFLFLKSRCYKHVFQKIFC